VIRFFAGIVSMGILVFAACLGQLEDVMKINGEEVEALEKLTIAEIRARAVTAVQEDRYGDATRLLKIAATIGHQQTKAKK